MRVVCDAAAVPALSHALEVRRVAPNRLVPGSASLPVPAAAGDDFILMPATPE